MAAAVHMNAHMMRRDEMDVAQIEMSPHFVSDVQRGNARARSVYC